jgi:hypothetical protein
MDRASSLPTSIFPRVRFSFIVECSKDNQISRRLAIAYGPSDTPGAVSTVATYEFAKLLNWPRREFGTLVGLIRTRGASLSKAELDKAIEDRAELSV